MNLVGKTVVRRDANKRCAILGQIVALLGSLAEVVNEVGEKTYVNVVDDKSVMVLAD